MSLPQSEPETHQQELARRIRQLFVTHGSQGGDEVVGVFLQASVSGKKLVWATLTPRKMAVYLEGACVYTEDGQGTCTGIMVPDAGHVIRELRQAQVLDDLAAI